MQDRVNEWTPWSLPLQGNKEPIWARGPKAASKTRNGYVCGGDSIMVDKKSGPISNSTLKIFDMGLSKPLTCNQPPKLPPEQP